VPLKIFGPRFTPYTDELRALASRLDLDASMVTFHQDTEKERLLEEYRHSKLLISGSHTECQPLVLLDAMATGTRSLPGHAAAVPTFRGERA